MSFFLQRDCQELRLIDGFSFSQLKSLFISSVYEPNATSMCKCIFSNLHRVEEKKYLYSSRRFAPSVGCAEAQLYRFQGAWSEVFYNGTIAKEVLYQEHLFLQTWINMTVYPGSGHICGPVINLWKMRPVVLILNKPYGRTKAMSRSVLFPYTL